MSVARNMRLKYENGFTMLEAVIAIAIGIIIIIAAAAALDSGMITASENRNNLYAMNALRSELEVLRRTNFDVIAAYSNPTSFNNSMINKLQEGAGTINIVNSFDPNIKKVTLTVSWRGRGRRERSQSITTYITREGLSGL